MQARGDGDLSGSGLALDRVDDPDLAVRDAIVRPLVAFNTAAIAPANGRFLAILLREGAGGPVVGGLWGRSAFDWLFVELLFVPEPARGTGLGRRLLAEAEAAARGRGCLGVWLDTLNPEARLFYERCGYAVFGEIADQPRGGRRTFFQKRLDGAAPGPLASF